VGKASVASVGWVGASLQPTEPFLKKQALHQQAEQVKKACEQAVALRPAIKDYRKSRGMNWSLLDDKEGAIKDFQYYLRRWNDDEEDKKKVQSWIATLEKGENPFTEEVLKALR